MRDQKLIADDKSVTGGLVAAATLFGASQLMGYGTWRSKKLARLLENTPRVLVRNGRILNDVLAREQVTRSELLEAVHRENCTSRANVRYAVLEMTAALRLVCVLRHTIAGGRSCVRRSQEKGRVWIGCSGGGSQ